MKRLAGYLVAIACCVAITVGLLYWPVGAAANLDAQQQNVEAPPVAVNVQAATESATPTQILDVARLVLETTRDQSTNVANHIDRATTVIVVFFSVLGAAGAMFGWYKVQDIKNTAEREISAFRTRLSDAESETTEKRAEFQKSLEDLTKSMRAEINAQSELMAARVQIDQAMNNKELDLGLRNRALRSAVGRIDDILQREQNLSLQALVRGMADKAYAEKRLGDPSAAFVTIVKAAELVAKDPRLCDKMRPLLAFNAACYACLLEKDSDAIYWLREAISMRPDYKASIPTEDDFERLRANPEFQALVQ